MSPFTRMLFPRPSFLEGLARIFDFGGSLNTYNYSRHPSQADARALASDWRAVGEDLWAAVAEADKEYLARKAELTHEQAVAPGTPRK